MELLIDLNGKKQNFFAIARLLKKFGYKMADGNAQYWASWGEQSNYTHAFISDGILFWRNLKNKDIQNAKKLSFDQNLGEITKFLLGFSEEIEIQGVGDYTAIVKIDKTVKVGCQTVSFEKVKELARAIEEMQQSIKNNHG